MGLYCLEITSKKKKYDTVSKQLLKEIKKDLEIKSVNSVRFAEFFDIQVNEKPDKIFKLAREAFTDPIIQKFSINNPIIKNFDFCIQVKFLPTITDNAGIVAQTAIEDFLERKLQENEKVFSGKKYFFKGNPNEKEIFQLCTGLLSNPQIEEFMVKKNE